MLENFIASLWVMLLGMIGIFMIIGLIFLCVFILQKVFKPKSDSSRE